MEFSNQTIIEYYLNRWIIKTNYKYFKAYLDFDEYKVQAIHTLYREIFLTSIFNNEFLDIYTTYHLNSINTIGDTNVQEEVIILNI